MKKIAFPNGKYFVEKKNITDTLFLSERTATGWYKERKNEIRNKTKIGDNHAIIINQRNKSRAEN